MRTRASAHSYEHPIRREEPAGRHGRKANGLSLSEIERSQPRALTALKSFRRQSDEGRYGSRTSLSRRA